jgi:hypothetical protein
MVDNYPNVEDKVKNDLVIGQVLKRDDWDRQKKIDFITEYLEIKYMESRRIKLWI